MKRIIFALLVAGAGAIPAVQTEAADIRVLSMAPLHPVLEEILPGWEKSTGHHVTIVLDTPSKQELRIANGETYDILLSNEDSSGRLERAGKFVAFMPVARVGLSVAVRSGAPKPDISTVAAFKAAMLDAKSAVTTDPGPYGSSGYVMMEVFARLGITEAMKPKMVFVRPPVTAAVAVADGRADIGLQQTSEMVNRPGVTVVGPLPGELQHFTLYRVGLKPNAPEPARALQALIAGPQARALLEQKGMSAP